MKKKVEWAQMLAYGTACLEDPTSKEKKPILKIVSSEIKEI